MSTDSVTISAVVPVYNTKTYLPACLESLCRQTFRDMEVLLVDDGSTDGSGEICDRFAEKDERIRVLHIENNGVSNARNTGIEAARGDYILFVDSDDYLEDTMCQQMAAAAQKNDADLVICANYNVATSGITVKHPFRGEQTFEGEAYGREIRTATIGLVGDKMNNPAKLDRLTPVWARLYRRSIVQEHNIRYIDLDRLPSECLQFNIELAMAASRACYVDEPLYYYRRNTAVSVTKPFRPDLWGKWEWWIDYMDKYLRDHGDDPDMRAAYYSRICCAVIPLGGNAIKLPDTAAIKAEMRAYLSREIFKEAFAHVDYSGCPIYWRMFFDAAKKRQVGRYLLLTRAMRKLLSYRKS
ncbi:MAG: glycosyltransferase [Clostridia bacterium]|nr:glycosyltransferase [Clostridia bacterium]